MKTDEISLFGNFRRSLRDTVPAVGAGETQW